MASRTFDLVVIGSGSAAQNIASRCRAAGWSVAMIDKRPFGGTCALRGCDPKKMLVSGVVRITGRLEPSRAVEVAERLPPAFLADVARRARKARFL